MGAATPSARRTNPTTMLIRLYCEATDAPSGPVPPLLRTPSRLWQNTNRCRVTGQSASLSRFEENGDVAGWKPAPIRTRGPVACDRERAARRTAHAPARRAARLHLFLRRLVAARRAGREQPRAGSPPGACRPDHPRTVRVVARRAVRRGRADPGCAGGACAHPLAPAFAGTAARVYRKRRAGPAGARAVLAGWRLRFRGRRRAAPWASHVASARRSARRADTAGPWQHAAAPPNPARHRRRPHLATDRDRFRGGGPRKRRDDSADARSVAAAPGGRWAGAARRHHAEAAGAPAPHHAVGGRASFPPPRGGRPPPLTPPQTAPPHAPQAPA